MKTNEEIFNELGLRKRICEEAKAPDPIPQDDEVTQAIIQNQPFLAPDTGFRPQSMGVGAAAIALAILLSTLLLKR